MLAVALAGAMAARAGAPVFIDGDLTDVWKWPREEIKWDQVILNTRTEIQRTDEVIAQTHEQVERSDEILRRMGRTETAVHDVVIPVAATMRAVEAAAELETEKHALDSSRHLYPPGSTNVRLHNSANRVEATFDANGTKFSRDPARYTQFAAQEAMYARYRTAAANEAEVVDEETKLQRRVLERLGEAKTESEVAVVSAALTASRQRLEIAHQKTEQAKSDLDAFRGQLEFERARKSEADREWAETVVDRMRAKALAAYRTQTGTNSVTARD